MNLVYFNGSLVPADAAKVSIFDRGFLYGDGLFETVRIQSGRPFRWPDHLDRLKTGLRLTGIQLPSPPESLSGVITELLAANRCVHGVLRLTVSRGPGARGYSPQGAGPATVALTLHPRPVPPATGLRLVVSTLRLLADNPLARAKTAAKLQQIVARAEAETAGADDALLLNHRQEIAETTSSNVFWLAGATLHTPPVTTGLLPGVARSVVREIAPALGLSVQETIAPPSALESAEAVFVTNCTMGPVEVVSLHGRDLQRSARFAAIRAAFENLVARETAGG